MNNNSSFIPPVFKSAPWCLNGHIHTILSSFLIDPEHLNSRRYVLHTPDEDFLELDITENNPSRGVVILLHGLEGSSKRYYILNLAHHLHKAGFTIAALNFRSCGDNLNKNRRFYHSGETDDLHTVSNWLAKKYPESIQLAAGFSLGGSALLNYLKKYKKSAIKGFAAISVPYDLYKGSISLQKGFNKIYNREFLKTLTKKLDQKRRIYPDLPVFKGSTLFEFDDQVTAPIHGFKDAEDYYQQCSSAFFMDQITTPGLLIHSRDDPLCPFEYTPSDKISKNPCLSSAFPAKGGHVGFWSFPLGWVEITTHQYFSHLINKNIKS